MSNVGNCVSSFAKFEAENALIVLQIWDEVFLAECQGSLRVIFNLVCKESLKKGIQCESAVCSSYSVWSSMNLQGVVFTI